VIKVRTLAMTAEFVGLLKPGWLSLLWTNRRFRLLRFLSTLTLIIRTRSLQSP